TGIAWRVIWQSECKNNSHGHARWTRQRATSNGNQPNPVSAFYPAQSGQQFSAGDHSVAILPGVERASCPVPGLVPRAIVVGFAGWPSGTVAEPVVQVWCAAG